MLNIYYYKLDHLLAEYVLDVDIIFMYVRLKNVLV